MTLRRRHRQATALVDAALEAYVDWREQSSAVARAYRQWLQAGAGERATAFAAYVTALDREQRAGDVYAA